MRFQLPVLALAAAVLAPEAPAQKKTLEQLEQQRDKKLADPWREHAPWTVDFDKARAEAKKSDKKIFAYFSRSYSP